MGKRNPSFNHDPLPSSFPDTMPCSSGTELLLGEKSSHSVDSVKLKHLSSVMDVTDSSGKLLSSQHSTGRHHHSLSHSIFLKRSRHYYGHQYSRRNSVNHAHASTSQGNPSRNERLSFKLASHCNSESGCRAENGEKAFRKRERVRASSLVTEATSTDVVKMVCGICQKQLRRKPCILGDTLSSSELSVVAVLVCGHIYHADCLGQKTLPVDIRDPPCPLCLASCKD